MSTTANICFYSCHSSETLETYSNKERLPVIFAVDWFLLTVLSWTDPWSIMKKDNVPSIWRSPFPTSTSYSSTKLFLPSLISFLLLWVTCQAVSFFSSFLITLFNLYLHFFFLPSNKQQPSWSLIFENTSFSEITVSITLVHKSVWFHLLITIITEASDAKKGK